MKSSGADARSVRHRHFDARRYDVVIAGCTALAAGIAGALTEAGLSCLMFDRAALPGHEFSSAMKDSGDCDPSRLKTERGRELYRRLLSRGAVGEDGALHIPAITPQLCEILGGEVCYYPATAAVSLENDASCIRLTLVSPGVRTAVAAPLVIDTTNDFVLGVLAGGQPERACMTLNAAMLPDDGLPQGDFDAVLPQGGRCEIRPACLAGEYIARFPCGDDTLASRAALRNLMADPPEALDGWRIIMLADEPDVTLEPGARFVSGILRAPSCGYGSALTAYDMGAALAQDIIGGKYRFSIPANGGDSIHDDGEIRNSVPANGGDSIHDDGEYDVIVAGLGTAGSIAAIWAARRGLKVLGIERFGCMGGMATAGGICSFYLGSRGGLYTELDREAAKLSERGFVGERGEGMTVKALTLEGAASDAGADIRLNAFFTDVLRAPENKKRVAGLCWTERDGKHTAKAKFVIDATSDGLVCLAAGCEMKGGRALDGAYQTYSVVSRCYNRKAKETCSRNRDDGRVDQYDPAAFGRELIRACASPLHLPERYDNSRLSVFGPAPLPGLREGARIDGEENVTLPGLLGGEGVAAPLFFEYANLDSHGKDTAFESRAYRDIVEICSLWDARIAVPIPAGALIPRGFSGLLVCGRAIAVDHELSFAVRMKDAMQKSGQAAAELAVAAIKNDCGAGEVDTVRLREVMLDCGVLGKGEKFRVNYYTPGGEACFGGGDALNIAADRALLRTMLASDSGGAAILSAAINIDDCMESLCGWLGGGEDGRLRFNCALAICLAGYDRADGEVRETVDGIISAAIADRSGDMPESSHTFNIPFAVAAMSAAGRAGIEAAIPSLSAVLTDPHYADDIPIKDAASGQTRMFRCREDMRLAYYTVALASLADICAVRPGLRGHIAAALPDVRRDAELITLSLVGQPTGDRRSCAAQLEAMVGGMGTRVFS